MRRIHVELLLLRSISMLLQLWLKNSSSSCPWNENVVVSWLAEMSLILVDEASIAFSLTLLMSDSLSDINYAYCWYSFYFVSLRKLEHN